MVLTLALACTRPLHPTQIQPELAEELVGPLVCDDAPVVTWETFGHGFLIEACHGCHAEGARSRADWRAQGLPESSDFETVENAWDWAPRILARVLDDTMPPAAALAEDAQVVSDDDKIRLQWWLICGEEGT